MTTTYISTKNAPEAIGTYSQAVKANNTVYFSGQIPLIPETMELVTGDFKTQVTQIFHNLQAVAEEAGGSFANFVKIQVFLTDLNNFGTVNEVMSEFFSQPYPARAVVGVAALPKNVAIEIDAIMVLPS